MKKIFISLCLLVMLLGLGFSIKADDELPEGETYLFTTINGQTSKIYHYGKGGAVTLPKKYVADESEMRGVWVATVYNIAIGKQKGTSKVDIENYKKEFLTILDRMEKFGMNTLFFQIRPANDAFYKSKLNPWSEFLVGAGIDPGWDPLEWMIEETHKRGFDFQCWMNAYRVTTSSVLPDGSKNASYYKNEELVKFKEEAISRLADGNFAKEHPEYVIMGEHDTRLILNPSEVAVQDFIVETLKEIIENYDIDGMHFDDYFYLNGSTSSDKVNTNFAGGQNYNSAYSGANILNDLGNYEEYKNNNADYEHMEKGYNLGDFRRESINSMMRRIRAMVDEYNKKNNDNVEFGSKPAAVWRSNSQYCTEGFDRCSPIGSLTASGAYSSYSDLFADTWKWVEEGLVDYVAPQVYYSFKDNVAGYADIVDWWAQMVGDLNEKRNQQGLKNIKLYIAHGIYKYRDAKDQFSDDGEIINQLKYTKKYDSIVGSAFYSYETLYQFASTTHENGVKYLRNNWTNNPVYPINRGENDSAGLKVSDYRITYDSLANEYVLSFDKQAKFRAYGLYKVPKGTTFDSSDLTTRIAVEYDPYEKEERANIRIPKYDDNYDYYVKVVSTNGYVSAETTKLDFSKVEEVESIKIESMSTIPSQVLKGSKVSVTTKVTNATGKELTYKVWYLENGVDYQRLLTSGKVNKSVLTFSFNTYNFESKNVQIKLEVTDGSVSTYMTSNMFDVVNNIKIDFTTSVSSNNITAPNSLIITVDINTDITDVPYLIKILDLNGNDITVVDSGTVTKKKIEAGWFINDDTYKQVVVYVMVGDETSTYTSDVINISVRKEETKKGGCKSDTVIKYIIASSTALALVLVIARKKK